MELETDNNKLQEENVQQAEGHQSRGVHFSHRP
jgi:hypothetical protein